MLVVCQVFHPDPQATSQLLSDLLVRLVTRGHSITVLAGYPGVNPKQAVEAKELWQGVAIWRGGMRVSFKKSILRRMLAYISYSGFVFWRLLRAPQGQKIFVITNPPFMPVLVWLSSWLRSHSYTVMLHDVYPEGLTALGRLRLNSWPDRIWRKANRLTFAQAHEVWVIGRDMQKVISQDYGLRADKLCYVPHWSPVTVARPKPADQSRLWRKLNLNDQFVVQYSGNMGLWHDIDTLVRAAALLCDNPKIHFLFIGDGLRRLPAERLAIELKATNITWIPFQGKDELEDSLACCHAALISQRAGLEGVAVPCKLYGILASGRTVIAQVPACSEVAMAVSEDSCGLVTTPGDAHNLAAAISVLANQPLETERFGRNAFIAYQAKYCIETAVETFDQKWLAWSYPAMTAGKEQSNRLVGR